jgi:hypothetical protein
MSTSTKTDAADRHHGGPGSSHQLLMALMGRVHLRVAGLADLVRITGLARVLGAGLHQQDR